MALAIDPTVHRLPLEQYHAWVDAGFLEGQRVDVEHEAVEVRTRPAGDHYEELHTARAGEVLVPGATGAPEVGVAALFAAVKRR